MQNESERAETELSQWLTEQGVDLSGKLADLQELYLCFNELTSLPESIGQLTDLQELYLGVNELTSLPESLGQLTNLQSLGLCDNELTSLPESIGQLTNLKWLNLNNSGLTSLPESIGQLTNLQSLDLWDHKLTSLPESISQLTNLKWLNLNNSGLTSLPESVCQLINLQELHLQGNPLTDLSPLQALTQENLRVYFLGADLPRRYWKKFSDWQPEWLLDENNTEIRRILIEQVGYERICTELGASTVDTWREYTLLKIDNIEAVYEDSNEPIDWEPLVLLKMTCPSTEHVHMLRVPPEMTSAETAVTWVNHGIHPDEFVVQT